jgi:GT2 family glycosyltransferase
MPAVTVSLVTYNGMRWLPRLFDSVRDQELSDFELLVLDNASTDGTAPWLRERAMSEPRMTLTESTTNLGYAAGHNRQIFGARADYVALLNQDIELDRSFLGRAVAVLDEMPRVAAVQGRIRRLAAPGERLDTLDSTGLEMGRSRRVVARRQAETENETDLASGPVWGADGPAPVYRRSALLDVRAPRTGGGLEVLDEDFFMYKEDVDLAWRLNRRGWQAWYEPQALAWHARGAAAGRPRSLVDVMRSRYLIPRAVRTLSWRNQRLMQIKNERAADLVRDLPWIAAREIASLAFVVATDPLRLLALPDFARAVPAALAKRRAATRPNRVSADV